MALTGPGPGSHHPVTSPSSQPCVQARSSPTGPGCSAALNTRSRTPNSPVAPTASSWRRGSVSSWTSWSPSTWRRTLKPGAPTTPSRSGPRDPPLMLVLVAPAVTGPVRFQIQTDKEEHGPFCGQTLPPRIETKSNSVTVTFVTDQSGDHTGWKILYTSTGEAGGACLPGGSSVGAARTGEGPPPPGQAREAEGADPSSQRPRLCPKGEPTRAHQERGRRAYFM